MQKMYSNNVRFACIAAACLVLAGCVQAKRDLVLPQLQVRQPLNASVVTSTSVLLVGSTDQSSVVVNGKTVETPSGILNLEYPLDVGLNLIDIGAGNGAGTTTVRLEVMRQ